MTKMTLDFGGICNGLGALNAFLSTRAYIDGCTPSQADLSVLAGISGHFNVRSSASKLPHIARWLRHIVSFSRRERQAWGGNKVEVKLAPKPPATACNNFYEYANEWWLEDEAITIPAEYPRWGSFIKLHDESLKSQINLLKEVAESKSQSPDERRLGLVWHGAMALFAGWEQGKGCYDNVGDELQLLAKTLSGADGSGDAWSTGLAAALCRFQQVGVGSPITWGQEANLTDAENIILDLSPSGLSLPARSYYLEDNFKEHRGWYKDHLKQVCELVSSHKASEQLLCCPDEWADRVMRFENKLAQISMKKAQSRSFDQYFTVTTVEELTSKLNSHAAFPAKQGNYSENKERWAKEGGNDDGDGAVLREEGKELTGEEQAGATAFLNCVVEGLGLRGVMEANYKQHYGSDDKSASARMMVFDGDYFRRVFHLLLASDEGKRGDVLAYMQYKIISSASDFCTKELDEAFFDFYNRKLKGQKEQKSAEKRSVGWVNGWFDELLGKIYVSRFFSEDDKAAVKGMVTDVLEVMGSSLKSNDWLTQATKDKALVKLNKFVVKIGYPDKWKNFDLLSLEDDDSLFRMSQKVKAFDYQTEFLGKLNTKKDKTKWEMSPQTVNAYFHPLNNEIVFPAAILQPPFYTKDMKSLDFPKDQAKRVNKDMLTAINFGGIGAVIAHEITHGYDDQGRKFDSDGNIKDWWQQEDAELFSSKTDAMAAQAEEWTFEPSDGGLHRMNGQLTMGENLADLGGMSLAVQALMKRPSFKKANAKAQKAQLEVFFRSWANVWKTKASDAFVINALATDPHAPTSFRANLVRNIDAWYDTFNVGPNDAMYLPKEKRVQMW